MNGYIAGFKGRKLEIQAESLYAAKVQALEHFKPSKKDAGLLWVELAERDFFPVTHHAGELP